MTSKANNAMEYQDWPEAVRLWEEIIKTYKTNTPADVWINVSVSLRRQGRFGKAEAMVRHGLKSHPNHIGLWNEFAEIAHTRNDWPLAIKRWREVLNKFKDKDKLAAVYTRLAFAYSKLGEYSKAEKTINEGLKAHPKHIHINATYAQIAMDQKNWPEAIMRWQKLVNDFEDEAFAGIWASLSTSLRNAQRLKEAEKAVKIGLAKFPGNIELRIVRAEIANDKKEWLKALNIWQELADEVTNLPSTRSWVKYYVRYNASVIKRIVNINDYKVQIKKYRHSNERPKIAIYTSFTKDYDRLKLPEIIDKRFDYFVYTDELVDGMDVYRVRPLNQPGFAGDGSRATRYPKTHPHVLMKGYDIAIWVDTSMMIVGDLMPIIDDFIRSGMPVGNATHPHRQSLSEELEACIDLRKDDPEVLKRQMNFYKSIGFDTKDLANNGVLLFNLKNKNLKPVMETWWQQICSYSKRDQLSFNYALFKNKADRYRLTQPPADIRNHQVFVFVPHHSDSTTLDQLYDLL